MQSHAEKPEMEGGKAAHVIAESRWEFHEGILFLSSVDQEGHSCTSDLICKRAWQLSDPKVA